MENSDKKINLTLEPSVEGLVDQNPSLASTKQNVYSEKTYSVGTIYESMLSDEEKETVAYDIKNLKIILDQFDKLESTFELTEDINTRRLLLQTILTKVTWDGENYEAELTILEDKKK